MKKIKMIKVWPERNQERTLGGLITKIAFINSIKIKVKDK